MIGSFALINSQLKSLGFKFELNLISLKSDYLNNLKKDKVNIINVDYNFKKPFEKSSSKSKKYISKCFQEAFKIINFNKFSSLINGPISKRYFLKGDPYHCHCHKTTRLLKEKFKKKIPFMTTFQSRFGPEEWLTPYTEDTLAELAKANTKNILIICPGFSSDCIETLEEINLRAKETFLKNGGKNFLMVPCLNDNTTHIDLLTDLVKRYYHG